MKRIIASLLVWLAVLGIVWAAGEAIVTKANRTVKKVSIGWRSVGADTVDATVTNQFSGEILKVTFEVDAGALAPSNNYDVVLNDNEGNDVLNGAGANLATNADVVVRPSINMSFGAVTNLAPVAVDGTLTIQVTNCGSNRAGDVHILYR